MFFFLHALIQAWSFSRFSVDAYIWLDLGGKQNSGLLFSEAFLELSERFHLFSGLVFREVEFPVP